MRTIPQNILDALEDKTSYRINAKIRVFASRHYFKTADITDNHVTLANPADYITSEAMCWNKRTSKINGVIIDNGKLKGFRSGSSTMMDLMTVGLSGAEIATSELSRPGIVSWGTSPSGDEIYFWDGTDWKMADFSEVDFAAGTEACIQAPTTYVAGATVPIGAIYPLDTGYQEAVILYIDEGGARAAFIDLNGNVCKSDGRFMDPNHVLVNPATLNPSMTAQEIADLTTDALRVHYGGAVKWIDPITGASRIYVYYTAYNGSVQGMYYEWTDSTADGGIWSEVFTAVPEDLSTFALGNVFLVDDRIWMIGKFTRRSDFASPSTYTLLLWSDDGKSFSLDRRTLVTTNDKRWLADYDPVGNNVYFVASGYLDSEPGAYQIAPTVCDYKEYRLKNFSGSSLNGWTANAVSGAELNFDYAWLDEGSYAELLVGVSVDDTDPNDIDAEYEWVTYQLCVVGGVDKSFKDGARNLRIDIVPDGIWHSQIMTYPFYMEIQGKQYAHSPMKTMDVLIDQSGNTGILWALSDDFSNDDLTDGFTAMEHPASSSTDHWCNDLLKICSEYPTFGDLVAYTIQVYGWSRAGALTQNPNVADATPTNTDNDDFYPIVLVKNPDTGDETTLVAVIGDLVSDHSNPEQTWFTAGARAGSYPIEFTIPNPGDGFIIEKLGCRVIAGSTGMTTYFLERVEMPEIPALYTPPDVEAGYVIENAFDPTGFNITVNQINGVTGAVTSISATHRMDYGDQTHGEEVIRFTTPNDGISHTYHIYMKNTLIAQTGWIGGGSNPQSFWVQCGTVADPDSKFKTELVGDNYPYHPNNYDVGSSVEHDANIELAPNTSYQLHWGRYDPWPNWDGWNIMDYTVVLEANIPPANIPSDTTGSTTLKQLKTTKKGMPQIFFTSHSVWNFDVLIRARIKGDYTYVGGIGLGTDRNNFIIGYMRIGKLGIAKIRDGVRTILYESTQAGILSNTTYDVRFWHRDGKFGVEYKAITATEWPNRSSQLVYEWTEADGIIAPQAPIVTIDSSGLAISLIDISEIDSAVWHVGLYSIIDPPKFRTTGFNSGSAYIPVMPLDLNPNTQDSDFLCALGSPVVQLFPTSGQVDCAGYLYIYTGKNTFFSVDPIEGPFQYRNVLDWTDSRYETDLDDSYYYAGARALEFYKFAWLSSQTPTNNHDKYNGALIGCSDSLVWENAETFHKPWVTTGGVVVFERERARFYSDEIPGEGEGLADLSTQCWITHGLEGVSPKEVSDTIINFGKGSFVFLDDDDEIVIQGFTFYSGEEDLSVEVMLDRFCRIAGTGPNFPGDVVTASHDFTDGSTYTVPL